jgi:hypothetical protein
MRPAEDVRSLLSTKSRELAWTRERLLLVPQSEDTPAFLAPDYERLEAKKRALEAEILALRREAAPPA